MIGGIMDTAAIHYAIASCIVNASHVLTGTGFIRIHRLSKTIGRSLRNFSKVFALGRSLNR
jgi:hypothetical protein